ncbi:MAG TPA: alpha/beta hydrolase [Ottowia sp.]|uniref:alpha/beta fold hydrolase n=1 Tax=Ottowia sp. TaxID=1898956 RepID=UPI002C4616EC|nr:alpha/beta hydrolase [Ottowia sp.]HMN21916.1 alpha/beta hydrolase [Ottowia sp.]
MQLSERHDLATSRGRFHVRMTSGAGIPLVMLHGWPENSYCWTPVAARLPERWRIIAPDLRGLGDSERTPGVAAYEKQQLAQDVLSVLDVLGVQRFHLVGHDWGGVVAQEMALARPERVRSLCLLNIVLINHARGLRAGTQKIRDGGNLQAWYQQFQRMPGDLFERLVTGREDVWLDFCFRKGQAGHQIPEEALREYIRMFRIPGTPGCGASYYRAMPADARRWALHAGRKYPMPALYIYGKQDPVIIPEYLDGSADAFQQLSALHAIDAGHFVQEEAPDAVARHLAEFLQPQD